MNSRFVSHAFIREWLFPAGCVLCGAAPLDPREARYGLCASCMASLTAAGERRCERCGRPLISERGRCLPCREAEERGEGSLLEAVFAVFPYGGPYRRLLRAYKFGKAPSLGNFLAEKLRESLAVFPPGERGLCWVPVPPRPGKIRRTGWDQVEHLAALLEKPAGKPAASLPLSRCLKRLASQSQKELKAEQRKVNLRGRIRCTQKPPRSVLLFDDLITTGSTLEACAAALKEGGAERVYGLTLFYR
ncbi:MAG: ComF family protein [Spirochaetaceae bacterium]|nr:ComF family protein [Spirochaetaceae bacterium]